MEKRFSIQMPFFPGFYETTLEDSDTSYWAIKNELEYYHTDFAYYNKDEAPVYARLTEKDLKFDYQAYEKEVMENFISAWKEYAPEIVESVEFDELDSPKYYNFRNDYLYCWVTLQDDWQEVMRKFIKDNHDWLKSKVSEDWTSYDGFISFMENDLEQWEEHLFTDPDPRYVGTMLGYMMYRENKDVYDDLMASTLEDVNADMYVVINEERLQELKDEVAKEIEEGTLVIPDPAQMKLPFPEA